MKKYLPFILLVAGILVLVGGYFLIFRRQTTQTSTSKEVTMPEISLSDRPVAALTPSSDGHWLKLTVTKIKISADSLDYELIYNLPDGRKQGVPGTIKLSSVTSIERDLLLGSESSGKYKYDEGIEKGTLTLRFRNSEGRLVAKFSTDFHLQSGTKSLTSVDGKFTYTLDSNPGREFLVTMQTFGYPGDAPSQIVGDTYGVFKGVAKINTAHGPLPLTSKVFPGKVSMPGNAIYKASGGAWTKLTGAKSDDVGIFVGTSQ